MPCSANEGGRGIFKKGRRYGVDTLNTEKKVYVLDLRAIIGKRCVPLAESRSKGVLSPSITVKFKQNRARKSHTGRVAESNYL